MGVPISLTVNGKQVDREVEPRTLLVHFLREELELTGTHVGCDTSSCGACTIHLDGEAVRSCTMPVSALTGQKITTLEGLGSSAKPSKVQQAFIDEQALQCGYCTSGLLMKAAALLKADPRPCETQIRQALADNLCRCGVHNRVVRAVQKACT